jgi:hypothetical protein
MESGQRKIGTIGAGKLGAAMADRLVKMGHAVKPSFSRDLAMALAFTMEPYTSSPALPGKRDRDRGRRSWQSTQKYVHLLVRGRGLSQTMSRYLIRRLEGSRSITLRPYAEGEAIEGNGRPEKIRWRNSKTSEVEVRDIRHLSCGGC